MSMQPSLEFQVGQEVDRRYLLKRPIARGGMAALFEAQQVHTGRRLVVKSLVEELAQTPAARARLLREGKALEMCRSPWVVDVLDASVDDQHRPFLALELLEGRSLDSLLTARARLPLTVAVTVLTGLCAGLEVVHRARLVHRDIKPGNLFIARDAVSSHDRVKLLDFGIVGMPDEESSGKITRMGERLGTRDYMPIEQLLTAPTTARTDLYAAMVVFFECVTGDVPFPGGRLDQPAPSIVALVPGLPRALDAVVARGLAREASDRFGTATEMAEAVRQAAGVDLTTTLLQPTLPATAPQARVFPRAPYITPCRVVDAEHRSFDGRLADLSEGGLLALFSEAPAAGKLVQLRFCLPVSGRAISVSAWPRWHRAARQQTAVGLEFEQLSIEAREEIRRFVSLMAHEATMSNAAPAPRGGGWGS